MCRLDLQADTTVHFVTVSPQDGRDYPLCLHSGSALLVAVPLEALHRLLESSPAMGAAYLGTLAGSRFSRASFRFC